MLQSKHANVYFVNSCMINVYFSFQMMVLGYNLLPLLVMCQNVVSEATTKPNIILILADELVGKASI